MKTQSLLKIWLWENQHVKMAFRKELIGSNVEVVYSNNKNLIGVKGKVIDETKNMIELENKKMIQKNAAMVMVNGNFEVDGRSLIGRSEDRIKRMEN